MGLMLAQTPPDEAVARGRQSLDHRWGGYPWYDPATDGVRRIDVSQPPAVRECSGCPSGRGKGDGPARKGRSNDWDWDGPDFGSLGTIILEIGKWFLWLALVAVFSAIVYLLVRAYLGGGRLRWARRRPPPKKDTDDERRIEALPFPVRAARSDFLAEARRCYEQGQYGEAVKYLFSYELVQLDKHHVVRLTRGKTNRQYLREVGRRGRAPLGSLLEQTMLAFEDFFFGNHAIDRTRFEACWSRLGEFETQLKGQTG
jgi:hypothetical protein